MHAYREREGGREGGRDTHVYTDIHTEYTCIDTPREEEGKDTYIRIYIHTEKEGGMEKEGGRE
jgi:hypothetical protein